MAEISPKYFPDHGSNLLTVSSSEGEKNIVEILSGVIEEFPPRESWSAIPQADGLGGLYCGPTGVAYVC